MNNRISETFATLANQGRKALIPYISAGDPNLDTTRRIVLELERKGADIVELGVPFSDPVADGPTIQRASLRALKQGTTLHGIVDTVAAIRVDSKIPIALMTYYNPILAYGVEKFCWEASRAGVDGLIIPDLPPEEAADLIACCREQNIATVFLVAPTSSADRIAHIDANTTGFLYCVSLTGVTGARNRMGDNVPAFMETVRSRSSNPLAIGFGISTPDHAREAARLADGIIVGSAIIDVIEQCKTEDEIVSQVGNFVKSLRTSIDE
ncbi:MAG: tryptophan synthase subunit alpha [Candidatus Latescibacteria bacterium]|jgi:tryptophan synthase alpha chain|nr:tryptophan synthase subunit alpha [Candidatus Latescibacterota bacterium]